MKVENNMKALLENWNRYLVTEDVEADGAENFVLRLPKLRISEAWGTPGTGDREVIEMFTSKIQGATLGEKINSLNQFVVGCDEMCASQKDVSEILANLVFLDCLSSVIYDFNDKTGGFLFESILAALFGGAAEQIETKGGRYQDVTDIRDDQGRNLSLKFFFSEASQYVGASYNNLVRSIVNSKEPMYYVVAVKNRESKQSKDVLSIDFYEFSVGHEDIEGQYQAIDLGKKETSKYNTGYGLPLQYATDKRHFIGRLDMGGSRKEIESIGQKYADRLGSILHEIYKQIDDLSSNVNDYFLNSPNDKGAAVKASQNAEVLKKETKELM
jgi:hypothetical protein|tara:strand:- start:95 stop:1078 length:984 start_codon:yes stop_codon:yes gene_type:complete